MSITNEPIDIVWEDPPGQGVGQPRKYEEALAKAKEQPGKWARVTGVTNTAASNKATVINKGDYPGITKGEYQATTRTIKDDEGVATRHLYIRYVGPVETA